MISVSVSFGKIFSGDGGLEVSRRFFLTRSDFFRDGSSFDLIDVEGEALE
jgi:hypothetical protein